MQLKPRKLQGLKPVALAAGLLMGAQPAMTATITWVGPNASFWDLLANWDAGLPGSLDDVALGAFETTFRSGTVGVRSFNGSGLLNLTGGQLSVSNNSFIGQLTLSGGTLAGAGDVTVSGAATFSGGQMLGTGTTVLNGLATVSSLDLDEGRSLQAKGGLSFAASASIDLNPNYTDSTAHGRLVNAATSTLTDNGGLSVYASNYGGNENGANARFVNAGTFNKGGAAASIISVGFENSGSVNVNQGTLRLSGGSTHTGGSVGGAGPIAVQRRHAQLQRRQQHQHRQRLVQQRHRHHQRQLQRFGHQHLQRRRRDTARRHHQPGPQPGGQRRHGQPGR
jgi:hypothetical protein